MSSTFPRDKDHIIDDLDDRYNLALTDEQVKDLRKLTQQQLFLITSLVAKAVRITKESIRIAQESIHEDDDEL